MKIFSPEDIRKYFYASCFLAIFCLTLAIIAIGESGQANVIQQSIMGHGDLYTRHDSRSASDLVISDNATVVYQGSRDWEGDEQTFRSSYIVSGAKGGYQNQYVVKASGAGYKHEYRATKIMGDFSGSSEISLTVNDDGAENLDSLILMDGNATFQGRIHNGQSGKPLAEEELDAVGKFVLRSYLNISEEIETPDNWLGFCDSLNRDMILADEVGAIYVLPENNSRYNYGYDVESKTIIPQLNVTR
ncbi:hypothetical protein M0R72_11810 [Candidatus Pacearchaeota archaeon]|jgi:hypothetical protein|nr:hypothetical protein [Candidatus Pacearchaeota archaeon]